MLILCREMCAWYVVLKGYKSDVYPSWAQCSKQVMGYREAVYKKYKSYEQAIANFNSTVNSIPFNKPSTSISVVEYAAPSSAMNYKNVVIIFPCTLVFVMWMKLNNCKSC